MLRLITLICLVTVLNGSDSAEGQVKAVNSKYTPEYGAEMYKKFTLLNQCDFCDHYDAGNKDGVHRAVQHQITINSVFHQAVDKAFPPGYSIGNKDEPAKTGLETKMQNIVDTGAYLHEGINRRERQRIAIDLLRLAFCTNIAVECEEIRSEPGL